MADGKTIIVDTSLCTGCRGCQVACKQWNNLPAEKTTQRGTYQNPPDFSGNTYKLVRFHEGRQKDGKPYWNFFSDMCRHCVNPPCAVAASADGEIIHDDDTGAVVYTPASSKSDFEMARDVCPYDIPRQDPQTKAMRKCTMCLDRQKENMPPACALACPTGAVRYGERDVMLEYMNKRVAELKKTWPEAQALNPDEVRVIFIVTSDPANYHEFAAGK